MNIASSKASKAPKLPLISRVAAAIGLTADIEQRLAAAQEALADAEDEVTAIQAKLELGEGGASETDLTRAKAARDKCRDRVERASSAAAVARSRTSEAQRQAAADALDAAWAESAGLARARDACLDRIIERQRENEVDAAAYIRLSEELLNITPRKPSPASMLRSDVQGGTLDRLLELMRWVAPTIHRDELKTRGMIPRGGVQGMIEHENGLSAWCGQRDFDKQS